ncbi:MAG TPA: mannose-6-phosphate isomerase, class I [bacterium]|nr:mannose-6-phosphate isomerase, class I [bacterium]HPN42724.1 mannose-6-phosphate isomerase, class I [bacterium]
MNFIESYISNPTILKLQGAIQHYAWGGKSFIPELLHRDNATAEPFAEYWLGAHPKSPAIIKANEESIGLNMLFTAAPQLLGAAVINNFGPALPYLFKILDAREMLSIQAHPSKQQAREGFTRENARGIPLDAPNRNYKDNNHKPEVHVALTDFYMLHGFRPLAEIETMLNGIPEFAPLLPEFAGNDLKNLYRVIMTMPQRQVDDLLNPLLARLEPLFAQGKLTPDAPDYWAVQASRSFPLSEGHRDRGLFSIYLLNLVHLQPGQGTFQAAGVPHAYLRGVNVELMANSDNVLRGGLTPKYIDAQELLKTLSFAAGKPEILNGDKVSATETVYKTPARDFELSKIHLTNNERWSAPALHGPDILIALEGQAIISAAQNQMEISRGVACFAPAGLDYHINSTTGVVLFRATVPLNNKE